MVQAPIKILYLIDCVVGSVAGTERQLIELMDGMRSAGCQPELAVFRRTPFLDGPHKVGGSIRVLGITRLASLDALYKLIKLSWFIRRQKIRLVHIFFNDAALVAPLFCRLGGAKVVGARRDMGFWYSRTNLWLLRISNCFVDTIVANSNAVAQNVAARERFPQKRIAVIYNGHDMQRFVGEPDRELCERFKIPPGAPIVGIVANLNPVKRHADLLKAFGQLRITYPAARLLLIGAGRLEQQLRDQATTLGIADVVHFVGSVSDAVPIVKLFSVGVLCSESEGFSNALIEYLACGIPVVATRVGGNTEVVTDGYNGFLVDVADVEQLGRRITELLADRSLATRMGQNALESSRRFTREQMIARYVALYRQTIGNEYLHGVDT